MKIALDARMMSSSGIGRYIQNLVENLSGSNGGMKISVLVDGNGSERAPIGNGSPDGCLEFHRLRRSVPVYSLREQGLLPIEMAGVKADLIHYPSFNMPVLSPAPSVVTIHDIIYYIFPDICPGTLGHLYARAMMRMAVKLSRRIITVSEHSKRDVVAHLRADPSRVSVIYNGVGGIYRPVYDAQRLRDASTRYKIDCEYILYVGNHKKHKNLENLLLAYAMLKNRKRFRLVIGGKKDLRRLRLYRMAEELGLEGRVSFIGEVPEEDLPALYTMASLFVFPSLYEGFGLPPLEAMACGTPVVASSTTSLPEVVGDAAVTVNPLDVEGLANAMDKVLSSKGLQAELRDRGFERAGMFSWSETARKTLEVYREALNGGN